MLEYHAAYHHHPDSGWYTVQVLDFPGTFSQGRTLRSARRMIRDALRMMAEYVLDSGEPLPKPDPNVKDSTAVFMEPIRLTFRARVQAATSHEETATSPAHKSERL